MITML